MPCRVVAEVSSTDWKASRQTMGSLRSLLVPLLAPTLSCPPATVHTGSTGSTEALTLLLGKTDSDRSGPTDPDELWLDIEGGDVADAELAEVCWAGAMAVDTRSCLFATSSDSPLTEQPGVLGPLPQSDLKISPSSGVHPA